MVIDFDRMFEAVTSLPEPDPPALAHTGAAVDLLAVAQGMTYDFGRAVPKDHRPSVPDDAFVGALAHIPEETFRAAHDLLHNVEDDPFYSKEPSRTPQEAARKIMSTHVIDATFYEAMEEILLYSPPEPLQDAARYLV